VIFLGIFSRKTTVIPLFIGDLLYSVMVFFIMRMVFINTKRNQIAFLALLICYSIELLQLYQADWINPIRKSVFGRFVLGQGFLWSDILAYSFGVGIAYLMDTFTFKTKPK
jgi:hypothetical protein